MAAKREEAVPVLDLSVLRAVAEPSGIAPRELLEFFISDARTNLRDLRDALYRGDRETVHRHAHSLKSSAASVGAMLMAAHARNLEQATKTILGDEATALGDALQATFADFEAAVSSRGDLY